QRFRRRQASALISVARVHSALRPEIIAYSTVRLRPDTMDSVSLRTLADRDGCCHRRRAAQHPERHWPPDAVAGEQIQKIFRRRDWMTVKIEEQIADEHAGFGSRAPGCHADDDQRIRPVLRLPLNVRKRHGLSRDPEIAALELPVFEQWLSRLPRNFRGDHNAKTANFGGGCNA